MVTSDKEVILCIRKLPFISKFYNLRIIIIIVEVVHKEAKVRLQDSINYSQMQ